MVSKIDAMLEVGFVWTLAFFGLPLLFLAIDDNEPNPPDFFLGADFTELFTSFLNSEMKRRILIYSYNQAPSNVHTKSRRFGYG